jgi:hypothetical protein
VLARRPLLVCAACAGNWDVAWSEGDDAAGSSQYRGPRPFSEPETRSLARLAADWRPDVFVDVRSGDRYMAMPYAHRAAGPSSRQDRSAMLDAMRSVSAMFSRAHPRLLAYGSVPVGPAASLGEEPYRASGTALDYMYTKAGVRRSYMLEVFGASTVYGVGGRSERAIGRLPSSASVVHLIQLDASRQPANATAHAHAAARANGTSDTAARANATAERRAAARRHSALHLRRWRREGVMGEGGAPLQPTSEARVHLAARRAMEESAEELHERLRRRHEVQLAQPQMVPQAEPRMEAQHATHESPTRPAVPMHKASSSSDGALAMISLGEGLHPASAEHVQHAAMLEAEERAEASAQRHRPRGAADGAQGVARRLVHGTPWPPEEDLLAQHGRVDSVARVLHLERPRHAARVPAGARQPSLLAIEERSTAPAGGGLSAGLESEERPFDCVAFFNPTTFDEFEVTVNAWADALLVLVNSSLAMHDAGRDAA